MLKENNEIPSNLSLQRTQKAAPLSLAVKRQTEGRDLKIPVPCAVCMAEEKVGPSAPPMLLLGEMHDSGVLFVNCPKGHRSAVTYNHPKHEIFFASGAMAFLDGYSYEAVSSFTAALERFYEFSIRVFCRKHDVPHDVLEASWKVVARQSERQFGAFCFLYALETGSSFSLSSKIPKFRNKVIHKGYIPSNDEVYDFAQRIFTKIRYVMKELRQVAEESIKQQAAVDFRRQIDAIPEGMPQASMGAISMHSSEWEDSKAFDEWIQGYRRLHDTLRSFVQRENAAV